MLSQKKEKKKKILRRLATIAVDGINGLVFIAADHFKIGKRKGPKISFLSSQFKDCFFNPEPREDFLRKIEKTEAGFPSTPLTVPEKVRASLANAKRGDKCEISVADLLALVKEPPISGKTETGLQSTTLAVHELVEASSVVSIIAELGDKHETSLAYLWALLKKQPKGEDGPLLTDGYTNIFYIRDATNTLQVVGVSWSSNGWHIHAFGVVDFAHLWDTKDRVFSR